MLNYMEFLNLPGQIAFVLAALFFMSQLIGEFIELQGKAVPEIMKVRKYFARKKKESETMEQLPYMMEEVKSLLEHYNSDNINKRDWWINNVDTRLDKDDCEIIEIRNELGNLASILYDMDVRTKRREILDFAEKIVREDFVASYESFEYISTIWSEYNRIIEERGIKNGVVEKSIEIIEEEYEKRLREGKIVEMMRGMNFSPKINFR